MMRKSVYSQLSSYATTTTRSVSVRMHDSKFSLLVRLSQERQLTFVPSDVARRARSMISLTVFPALGFRENEASERSWFT